MSFIDFAALKAAISIDQAAETLGLTLKQEGSQFRTSCPACKSGGDRAIVLTPAKLVYLGALLAPLAFLPLLAPRVLAAALPGLAMNLLSLDPKLIHYQGQYQAFVLPFLMLAAVEGYARLREIVGPRRLFGRHGAASAFHHRD